MAELEKLRHAQIVVVDMGALLTVLRGGIVIAIEPPLPDDTEVVAVGSDWHGPYLEVKVCSWEWPLVPFGAIPPRVSGNLVMYVRPLEERKDATNG